MKFNIILTKSAKVAKLLADLCRPGEDNVVTVSHGMCDHFAEVPAIYCNKHLYACVVEYTDEAEVPDYELIFA